MSAAIATELPERELSREVEFHPWLWAAGVTLVCAIPLLLMALGVDFSTQLRPLLVADVGTMTQPVLGEAVQAAVRGNYTHTLLEWTASPE